ncbi:hypothetical protein KC341_g97 [Hortaea werneckii]|nr:hypothetical protein KC341_g97 [Hortaea werneckii]
MKNSSISPFAARSPATLWRRLSRTRPAQSRSGEALFHARLVHLTLQTSLRSLSCRTNTSTTIASLAHVARMSSDTCPCLSASPGPLQSMDAATSCRWLLQKVC